MTRSSPPTSPSPCRARPLEVHHGDGLVDQQLFTLPVRAKPADIPDGDRGRRQRPDHRRRRPGGRPARCRPGVTTDARRRGGHRHRPAAPGPGARRARRAEAEAAAEGAEPPSRGSPTTASPPARTRPCAASSGAGAGPGAAGARRGTPADLLVVGLGNPGRGVRRHPAQRRGRAVARLLSPATAAAPAAGEGPAGARSRRSRIGGSPGGPGRPHHLHERVGRGRPPLLRRFGDRGPGPAGGRPRRAGPAARAASG